MNGHQSQLVSQDSILSDSTRRQASIVTESGEGKFRHPRLREDPP
ncbi:hypothetical protein BN2537_6595 [Streptomyces venezuelae]|nr:hypothetical protein BN2537_6595 [Streptomyces venezuelae]